MTTDHKRQSENVRSVATHLLDILQWCEKIDQAVPGDDGLVTGGHVTQYTSYRDAIDDSRRALEWLALSVSSMLLESPEVVAAHLLRGDRMVEQRDVTNGLSDIIVENTDISAVKEES